MSGLEVLGAVVGVAAVVAQVISAYRDGGSIVDRIKEKRAARKERPLPKQLEETIKETPIDIEKENNRGLAKFGRAFEQGDYIAIITIQQIAIQVHSSFFEKLRNAYDEDAEFTSLIHDADMGRNRTIMALMELQQRLLLAGPIPNAPVFSQARSLPFQANTQPQMGLAQVVTLPIAGEQSHNLLPDANQSDSIPVAAVRDQHQRRFHLFHRSRKQSHYSPPSHDPQDPSSELGQHTFQRVQTIPTYPDCESSPVITRIDSADPTASSHSQSNNQSFDHIRWCSRPSVESWDYNPWADDGRTRNSSVVVASQPAPSLPPPNRTSTARSYSSTHSIPHPNPENNYLGFCKGAWKLQDGDKKAMVVCRDYTQSAQSASNFLRCSECKFEGHMNPDILWSRVFKFDAQEIKIKWAFLAKSHVKQRYPLRRDQAKAFDFTYQCIFCAFLGHQEPAIHGAEAYRDHIISRHRGAALSDVVLYKANAVNNRLCADTDDFDINLYSQKDGQFFELGVDSYHQS